jgi:hypothetical protein
MTRTGLLWLWIGTVKSSCEHGNEPLGFIKCWKVLEWLHNWRPLEKVSAPWSQFIITKRIAGGSNSLKVIYAIYFVRLVAKIVKC